MSTAARLAGVWIDSWSRGDPGPIPFADDFIHISPFGRIEGREAYLAFMEPMIGTPMALSVVRSLSNESEAVIHYTMQTPDGDLDACDWVKVEDGRLTEVHAFYDATTLRSSSQ